jgi:hypothetical protein
MNIKAWKDYREIRFVKVDAEWFSTVNEALVSRDGYSFNELVDATRVKMDFTPNNQMKRLGKYLLKHIAIESPEIVVQIHRMDCIADQADKGSRWYYVVINGVRQRDDNINISTAFNKVKKYAAINGYTKARQPKG